MAIRKTMSFALVHFAVAFTVTWAVTDSLVIGGMLALIEPVVSTIAFYVHEQAWQRAGTRRTVSAA